MAKRTPYGIPAGDDATYNAGNNYGGSLNPTTGIHLYSGGLSEPTRTPRPAAPPAMTGGDWQGNRDAYLKSIGAGSGYSLNPQQTAAPRANLDPLKAQQQQAAQLAAGKNHMPIAAIGGRNNVYAPGFYGSGQGQGTIVGGPNSEFHGSAVGGGFGLGNTGFQSTSNGNAAGGGGGNVGVGGIAGRGGGAGGGLAGQIGNQLQRDQNAANAANKAINDKRAADWNSGQVAQQGALDANYNAIYGTLDSALAEQKGYMAGQGDTAHTLEDRRLSQQQGKTSQNLVGHGLGNSTITEAMARGNATDSALIQNAITEGVNKAYIAMLDAYAGRKSGAQADYAHAETQAQQFGQAGQDRITDDFQVQGPNASDYYRLLAQPGSQGGYGAAGSQSAGNNSDGGDAASIFQAYLASLTGGGAAGANPWVDPRTVAANANARRVGAEQQAKSPQGVENLFDSEGFGKPNKNQLFDEYGFGSQKTPARANGAPPINYAKNPITGEYEMFDPVTGQPYPAMYP